jgi:hypothetical protein
VCLIGLRERLHQRLHQILTKGGYWGHLVTTGTIQHVSMTTMQHMS